MRPRRNQDAFGQALLDAHEGRDPNEFVERDDGHQHGPSYTVLIEKA